MRRHWKTPVRLYQDQLDESTSSDQEVEMLKLGCRSGHWCFICNLYFPNQTNRRKHLRTALHLHFRRGLHGKSIKRLGFATDEGSLPQSSESECELQQKRVVPNPATMRQNAVENRIEQVQTGQPICQGETKANQNLAQSINDTEYDKVFERLARLKQNLGHK